MYINKIINLIFLVKLIYIEKKNEKKNCLISKNII